MGNKLDNAKNTDWVAKGLTESESKTTIELAKISAKIERCRLDMRLTQTEFADYMGVSQGMISKWESREYNFTVKSLNEIFHKLGLELDIGIKDPQNKYPNKIITWGKDQEAVRKSSVK